MNVLLMVEEVRVLILALTLLAPTFVPVVVAIVLVVTGEAAMVCLCDTK